MTSGAGSSGATTQASSSSVSPFGQAARTPATMRSGRMDELRYEGAVTVSAGVRFHEQVHGVYFDDLDAFQILHYARYLLLFERTICSFWNHLGWGGTLDMQKN